MKKTVIMLAIVAMSAVLLVAGCEKIEREPEREYDLVNVNPNYVAIDWESADLQTYDDSTGNYVIQFNDAPPDIQAGAVIAIDRDTTVYYRFVTSVQTNGTTMTLTTVEATLNDIFYDSDFTLSTAALQQKSVAGGHVVYPVSAYVIGDDGTYHEVNISGTAKSNTRFTERLWDHTLFDLDGTNLAEGEHYKLWLEKFNASMKVDLQMRLNFGGRTEMEMINGMLERYRSKTLGMDAYVIGKFDTEQKIRFDAWNRFSNSPEYQLLKHNLFRPVPIKFMVPAGPVAVPVVVVLRCDLFYQYEVSGSGEISAYMGFTDHAEGLLGMEWRQTGGITPVTGFENTFNYTAPTVEGKGQLQGKVWLFPRIKLMIYDRIGPSIDVMPWLADTVRGGFREQMLGQSNDYCAWSIDHHAGLDVRFGLSRNNILFGYEVANDTTPKYTLADVHLYHSPRKVVHVSGRPHDGGSATVAFDVYDTNYLTHTSYKTLYPQIVKFEAGGRLSSEYGIAVPGTGRVSVGWTPNNNDTLWAKLYDEEGNVIAFDTVIVQSDCDWVDLGLPSGLLWATRNVGAASPTDYGNYYAWGETSPKSYYDWSTYRYATQDANGNWIMTKYNTQSDNLVTLMTSDDAAAANYGGRTPTYSEWDELLNYTTSRWTTVNGVSGRCFTGPNGNSLFLPAAGYRYGSELYNAGENGNYWSSSLHTGNPNLAWDFDFHSGRQYMDGDYRRSGYSVRAVRSQN